MRKRIGLWVPPVAYIAKARYRPSSSSRLFRIVNPALPVRRRRTSKLIAAARYPTVDAGEDGERDAQSLGPHGRPRPGPPRPARGAAGAGCSSARSARRSRWTRDERSQLLLVLEVQDRVPGSSRAPSGASGLGRRSRPWPTRKQITAAISASGKLKAVATTAAASGLTTVATCWMAAARTPPTTSVGGATSGCGPACLRQSAGQGAPAAEAQDGRGGAVFGVWARGWSSQRAVRSARATAE